MKIETYPKECLKQLYIYRDNGRPIPMYYYKHDNVSKISKKKVNEKLAKTVKIYDYIDGEQKLVATLNEFKLDTIMWYKIDGLEVPFNDMNMKNKNIIDKVIQKIIKSTTQPQTKAFLLDILKGWVFEGKISMKQKFILVCKGYSVSDLPFKKKKPNEIGSEQIGFLKGESKKDISMMGEVQPLREMTEPIIKPGTELFAWKVGKNWTVSDKELKAVYRISPKMMKQLFKPKEVTDEGTSLFIKVRNILESQGAFNKDEQSKIKT